MGGGSPLMKRSGLTRETTKLRGGTGAQKMPLDSVNWYSGRARPLLQRRAHRSDQLR